MKRIGDKGQPLAEANSHWKRVRLTACDADQTDIGHTGIGPLGPAGLLPHTPSNSHHQESLRDPVECLLQAYKTHVD